MNLKVDPLEFFLTSTVPHQDMVHHESAKISCLMNSSTMYGRLVMMKMVTTVRDKFVAFTLALER